MSMNPGLHTLTVQDVLWVNFQLAKVVNTFSYPQLEEATFYQFGYGSQGPIEERASRVVRGFERLAPFSAASHATGFVTALAFMSLNGHDLKLADSDGANWHGSVLGADEDSAELWGRAVKRSEAVGHHDNAHLPSPKEHIKLVLNRYPSSIQELLARP